MLASTQGGKYKTIQEIAKAKDLPAPFLAKILKKLGQEGPGSRGRIYSQINPTKNIIER